jgi:hypothetical protein
MASLTAKEIVDKVTELRSKIGVYEMLLLHLRTNYLSTEGKNESEVIPPEMHVQRDDGARVPEKHVVALMSDLTHQVDEMKSELEDWESLPMDMPTSKKKKKKDDADKPEDTPAS